jgi:hypothetical protein
VVGHTFSNRCGSSPAARRARAIQAAGQPPAARGPAGQSAVSAGPGGPAARCAPRQQRPPAVRQVTQHHIGGRLAQGEPLGGQPPGERQQVEGISTHRLRRVSPVGQVPPPLQPVMQMAEVIPGPLATVSAMRGAAVTRQSPGPVRPTGEIRNRASPTSCNQADADDGRIPRPAAGNAAARVEMDAAVAPGQDGSRPGRDRRWR